MALPPGPRIPEALQTMEWMARPTARQRRLILPPLHGEKMRSQAPLVAELAERELASWPRGQPVATLPRMRALTLEVVLRLVFGARDRAEVEPLRAAIERPLQITSSLPRLL